MRGFVALGLALAVLGPPAGALAGDWDSVPDEVLERLAVDLQRGRDAAALAETLKAQVAAQAEENAKLRAALAELKAAERSREIAVAIAEDRDKRRQENEDALKGLLDRHEKLLTKALDRVDKLEQRQQWMMFGGLVGLLAMGLFVGF